MAAAPGWAYDSRVAYLEGVHMKRIVLPAAILALACSSAWAQPKPAEKPEAKKEAPSADKAARKSRRHEDARACLEKASNSEIIKCAEAYL